MFNEVVSAIAGEKGLLKEIYGDLAKPGVTQVGKALETVLGLGNTVLIPLQLLNEKGKYVVGKNLEVYRQKLESSDVNQVIGVAPEVGVPIVEKLTYVTNEQLVELYTELLSKASKEKHCKQAHPNFVNIINSLSPDEAVLVQALKSSRNIPFVDRTIRKPSFGYRLLEPLITGLEDTPNLMYPENTKAYLSNLESLGLLKIRRDIWTRDDDAYNKLALRHEVYISGTNSNESPDIKKGVIEVTELGIMFISSCVVGK